MDGGGGGGGGGSEALGFASHGGIDWRGWVGLVKLMGVCVCEMGKGSVFSGVCGCERSTKGFMANLMVWFLAGNMYKMGGER